MSWQIETVTLPAAPLQIILQRKQEFKEIMNPGGLPIIISVGARPTAMTWNGTIIEEGRDASYLITNYISPLSNLVGTEVTLSTPYSIYNGDWLLVDFRYEPPKGPIKTFEYTLNFVKGSSHIVL